MKTVIGIHFEENVDREKEPFFTGLVLTLEDGTLIKHYSTDMTQHYGKIENDVFLAQ